MKLNIILITLVSIANNYLFSQNISILGEVNNEQFINVEKAINSIANKNVSKKIFVFCGDDKTPIAVLNKKNLSSDILLLKSSLKSFCKSKKVINFNEYDNLKTKLSLRSSNNIYTYFENGETSRINEYIELSDFTQSIQLNNKISKKDFFIIVISKARPKIKINSPKAKSTINYLECEGTSESENVGISEVLIRVNNGEWIAAEGTESWSHNFNITSAKIKIEALAIDDDGDTSNIVSIKDIKYEKININPNSIVCVMPNEYKNVVDKCITDFHRFMFKFSIKDRHIDLKYLKLIVEDQNGNVVSTDKTIYYYTTIFNSQNNPILNSTEYSSGLDNINYCFSPEWSFMKNFATPCSIDIEENFYYYFLYFKDPANIIATKKTLIHFSSIDDSDNEKKVCDCE